MKKPAKPERKQVSSKEQKPARPGPQDNPPEDGRSGSLEADFPIVGIGASAGGLEAMGLLLREVPEGIQSLTRFPSETPNPVLRITRDGTLLYANEAGLSQLSEWHLQAGQAVPPMLREVVLQSLDSRSTQLLDTEHGGRVYSFFVAPVVDADYANLYGCDVTERKRAEEALRESETQFRTVINTCPDAIVLLDLEGRILVADQQAALLVGFGSSEELLSSGKNGLDLFAPEDRQRARDNIGKLLEVDVLCDVEYHGVRRDGRQFPVEVSAALQRDLSGNPKGTILVLRDITERRQAKEELQKAKDYADNIIRSMADMLVVLSPDGTIATVNRAACDLLGYPEHELIGQPATLLLEEEEEEEDTLQSILAQYPLPVKRTVLRRLVKEGSVSNVEKSVRTKTGERIPILLSGAIMRDDGKIRGIVCLALDISERKRADEALRESEDRFRAMFESARDGILAADVTTKEFLFGNKAIHQMLGYTPEEIITLAVSDIHPPEDLPAVNEAFAAQARGESELAHDLPVQRKDGSVFYADINSFPLNLGGRPVLVGVFRDVTERKQAEEATRNAHEQLAEQQRHENEHVETELKKVRGELVRTTRLAAIGQISASIAHDLRNPLGAAINAIYYLRHGSTKDASKTAEYLEIIDQEIGVANRLIDKLLDMARGREPAKKAVDLGRTVEEVFKAAPGAEPMRCRTALCPDPFLVEADPDQLRRVIANLLSNAIQATKGRGEFLVEASRGPGGDTILFRDTGPGIPPEIRQSVFEPLVTNRTLGTGLGLTICREIVRRHGGAIEIIDHEEGGAAFQIRLPRESP